MRVGEGKWGCGEILFQVLKDKVKHDAPFDIRD
jgi:hypothetical protein